MADYEISYLEDEEILAIPEVLRLLNVARRKQVLKFTEIKTLVKALQPGMARSANLERYGEFWRLRFVLRLNGGTRIRKSIVVSDSLDMAWVADYIKWARSKRREYRAGVATIRFQKRWEDGGNELAEKIAARIGAYTHALAE